MSKITEEIDYEAEVKKVYPEAYCDEIFNGDWIFYIYTGGDCDLPIVNELSEEFAWESAYNNIAIDRTTLKAGK